LFCPSSFHSWFFSLCSRWRDIGGAAHRFGGRTTLRLSAINGWPTVGAKAERFRNELLLSLRPLAG